MFCRARREGIESARGNAEFYLVLYKDFLRSGSHGSPAAPGLTSVRNLRAPRGAEPLLRRVGGPRDGRVCRWHWVARV